MRVLVDTNILILAALSSNGTPYKAFLKAVTYPNKGIICDQNIEELRRIFNRKFPQKISLLEHFQCPEKGISRGNEYMGGADSPLFRRYSQMADRKDLVYKIIKDLQNDGLLSDGDFMNTTMSVSGIYAKRTTNLGDGFLKFISQR